jgi:2-polyprenyl-6-methoxyphenol hydroxylase-like FAD-dependent oxidoreductase
MAVLIIGAGIAGLTTALSLHQIGVEARVFESVQTIEPLGVGINTLPHAVRELTELGLADRLAAGFDKDALNSRPAIVGDFLSLPGA